MKKMFCVMGEGASGKTTLAKMVEERLGINEAISDTSRKMREGEVDGINYHFRTKEEMLKLKEEGYYAEWNEFGGEFYALSYEAIDLENSYRLAVVTPGGYLQLRDTLSWENVVPVYIQAEGRKRLLRYLNRDGNIDVYKVCERFLEDKEEFEGIFCLIHDDDGFIVTNDILEDAYMHLVSIIEHEIDKREDMIDRWNRLKR